MARSVKLYEAVRGDECVSGTAQEVADRIGIDKRRFYPLVKRGKVIRGWSVRQTGIQDRRVKFAAYYVFDENREDPIIGNAEEVAEIIGIMTPNYLSSIADNGRLTKNWYYVERVKEGDHENRTNFG